MVRTSTFLVLMLVSFTVAKPPNCSLDKRLKFILKNMNKDTVKLQVDCVVGKGHCDKLGQELKARAESVVRATDCFPNCSCEEFKAKVLITAIKKRHSQQWDRVLDHFSVTEL